MDCCQVLIMHRAAAIQICPDRRQLPPFGHLTHEDRQYRIQDFDLSKIFINKVLYEELLYLKILACWVLKNLIDNYKVMRIEASQTLLPVRRKALMTKQDLVEAMMGGASDDSELPSCGPFLENRR